MSQQQQQQSPLLQQLTEFIWQSTNDDSYLLFVCRFLIYFYIVARIIAILRGYEKPNITTRVYRKFQLVYSGEILKQMEIEDIQDLQVTIKNTIQNATKQMKGITVSCCSNGGEYHHSEYHSEQSIKNTGHYSQRRSLSIDETSQTSLGKKPSRIKFNLSKNEYFDPIDKKAHQPQHQSIPTKSQSPNNNNQIIQEQSEQQILSPIPRPQRKVIKNIEMREQVDTHYPQDELNTISLNNNDGGQKKLNQSEQNLLHLQDEILTNNISDVNGDVGQLRSIDIGSKQPENIDT